MRILSIKEDAKDLLATFDHWVVQDGFSFSSLIDRRLRQDVPDQFVIEDNLDFGVASFNHGLTDIVMERLNEVAIVSGLHHVLKTWLQ